MNPEVSTQCADETLNSVLYGVFCDFMDGDLETIRTFLSESLRFPHCFSP